MSKFINNWKPEIKSLLKSLAAAGCTILSADNGEDEVEFTGSNTAKIIECLTACDEAWLYVTTPTRPRKTSLYIVLGNSPGELVADYTIDDTLDKVTKAHGEKWEERLQPKIECPRYKKDGKRIAGIAATLNEMIDEGRFAGVHYCGKPIGHFEGQRFAAVEGTSCGQQAWLLKLVGAEEWDKSVHDGFAISLITDISGNTLFPYKA